MAMVWGVEGLSSPGLLLAQNTLHTQLYNDLTVTPGQGTDENSSLPEVYQMWQTSEDGWRVRK